MTTTIEVVWIPTIPPWLFSPETERVIFQYSLCLPNTLFFSTISRSDILSTDDPLICGIWFNGCEKYMIVWLNYKNYGFDLFFYSPKMSIIYQLRFYTFTFSLTHRMKQEANIWERFWHKKRFYALVLGFPYFWLKRLLTRSLMVHFSKDSLFTHNTLYYTFIKNSYSIGDHIVSRAHTWIIHIQWRSSSFF